MKKLALLAFTALAVSTAPALADHHEGGDHKGHGEKMFMKMDVNNDGVVSREEFVNHAGMRFDKMDADNNGDISMDEAEAAKKDMRKRMKDMKEKMEMSE